MKNEAFEICMPKKIIVLVARLGATLMMHLVVEVDIRDGLTKMKYATNNPHEFRYPAAAFLVGLMQSSGGIISEVMCILFLSTLQGVIEVIIRFMAFASIAKVDDIYASALPDGNKIKGDVEPL